VQPPLPGGFDSRPGSKQDSSKVHHQARISSLFTLQVSFIYHFVVREGGFLSGNAKFGFGAVVYGSSATGDSRC